jgi:hypothetical protein
MYPDMLLACCALPSSNIRSLSNTTLLQHSIACDAPLRYKRETYVSLLFISKRSIACPHLNLTNMSTHSTQYMPWRIHILLLQAKRTLSSLVLINVTKTCNKASHSRLQSKGALCVHGWPWPTVPAHTYASALCVLFGSLSRIYSWKSS